MAVPVGNRSKQSSVPVQDAAGPQCGKPFTPERGQCVSEAHVTDVFRCRLVAEQREAFLSSDDVFLRRHDDEFLCQCDLVRPGRHPVFRPGQFPEAESDGHAGRELYNPA